MPTKQEIIDAVKPGVLNTNARFVQLKREDVAVLCDIDLASIDAAKAAVEGDPDLAAKQARLAELEKRKLDRQIAELEAEEAAAEAAETDPEEPSDDEPTEDDVD